MEGSYRFLGNSYLSVNIAAMSYQLTISENFISRRAKSFLFRTTRKKEKVGFWGELWDKSIDVEGRDIFMIRLQKIYMLIIPKSIVTAYLAPQYGLEYLVASPGWLTPLFSISKTQLLICSSKPTLSTIAPISVNINFTPLTVQAKQLGSDPWPRALFHTPQLILQQSLFSLSSKHTSRI